MLAGLIAGCSGGSGNAGSGREVVTIEKTKSYHTGACLRVCMARTRTMTIGEAKALGLKPCPGCKPDSTRSVAVTGRRPAFRAASNTSAHPGVEASHPAANSALSGAPRLAGGRLL